MVHPDEIAYRAALAVALRILSVRDHSVAELTRKLARRGHAPEVVGAVIDECLRLNYLDDGRAVQQAIDRLKRRGCGIRRIRSELAQRGLAGADAQARLRESLDPQAERALALRVAQRKWTTLATEPDTRKRIQRLQRFLHARGFTESTIFDVCADIEPA
jgi:regulatory protein